MKTLKISLITLVAGLLAACGSLVQEVHPGKLVSESPKLVVACFISPQDTLVAAKITQNNPVVGDTTTLTTEISNATVTLSSAGRSVSLLYDLKGAFYQVDTRQFPIVSGQTYTLAVSTPDGRSVTATATVPPPVAISEIRLDSTQATSNGNITKTFFVAFRWKDPAGTANFYRIAGTFAHAPLHPETSEGDTLTVTTVNFRSTQNRRALYTDEGADGNTFNTPNGIINQSITAKQADKGATAKLSAFTLSALFRVAELRGELLNTDEMYYRYHQSIEQFRAANGNPFAEPVLVPTNIQNGLGCFAAYNRSTMLLKLK